MKNKDIKLLPIYELEQVYILDKLSYAKFKEPMFIKAIINEEVFKFMFKEYFTIVKPIRNLQKIFEEGKR